MRLAPFLEVTGIGKQKKEKFNALRRHDNLPFATHDADKGEWQTFTLDDAFRMRLMLDLVGAEGEGDDTLHGLPPSYAVKLVSNAMGRFDRHPLSSLDGALWAGVAIFEDTPEGAEPYRYSRWFAGDLADLAAWISEMSKREDGTPVRLFAANASRAAKFVRDRAAERGLPEARDFSQGEA